MKGYTDLAFRGTQATMIVVNTPSKELAFTNSAHCSTGDFQKFAIPGSNPTRVLIGDSVVLSLFSHNSITDGRIALNFVHRRHTKVLLSDQISVITFFPSADFSIALLTLELDYVKARFKRNKKLNDSVLAQHIHKKFNNQVMTTGQRVLFEFLGTNYIFTVNQAMVENQEKTNVIERGLITDDTYIVFEVISSSRIKIINQREVASSNIFKHKQLNLEKLGIGGLSEEFTTIFRRVFATRVLPPHVMNNLGIKHVKGLLLHGPPGTGKTLLARQIGKFFNGREPKIVNGPEILNKNVGETVKNVSNLFADAEHDERTRGDQSDLHIIIFDEIDAICKTRGSTRDGTSVHDCIVNQLLTKIDGVESLNNILLIGIASRKDLLDKKLLRPGRLEVHVEINLPDENGRLQILQIHTNKMRENSFLATDVKLQELAARSKNYNGAELEAVVKSAVSYAVKRQVSPDDHTKPIDYENIKVTMNDFLITLQEIIPAFASIDDLQRCRVNGIVDCGERHNTIYKSAMFLVRQVKEGNGSQLVTCLLEGPVGSGKTAMAATIGIDSDFPFIKIISAKAMLGLSESNKCAKIIEIFEDAYKSQLSIIILDDIERLLDYVAIGPRFSNLIVQTLLVLLNTFPPKGRKLFIIGTTSQVGFLKSVSICNYFSDTYHVPTLTKEDAAKVLEHIGFFARDDIDAAAEALHGISLKNLYMVVKSAVVGGGREGNAKNIYSGKAKIDINYFFEILSDYI